MIKNILGIKVAPKINGPLNPNTFALPSIQLDLNLYFNTVEKSEYVQYAILLLDLDTYDLCYNSAY